jgi:hypothetical protein
MNEKRIENAKNVIQFAIDNDLSVYEASNRCGYANTYVKNVKALLFEKYDDGEIGDDTFNSFMNLYNEYEKNKNTKIFVPSKTNTNKNDEATVESVGNTKYKNGETIEENVSINTGEKTITKYFFEVPPTEKDIKEEFKIDDITTQLSHYWVKGKSKGYFVSANIKVLNKDFYSVNELKNKLKSLLPNYLPTIIPKVEKFDDEKAIFILLADDHAGIVNEFSVFGDEKYDESMYKKRLVSVFEKAKTFGSFDKCFLLSTGDQLNSWNNNTTRGGHEVKSMTNKDQFDFYIRGRRMFYDLLFTSKISNNYHVIDIENSNHSGLGLSYMANTALEFYLEGKYPQVKRESMLEPFNVFEYGNHVFGVGHGKDEKYMRAPMPLNLDNKTDLFLLEYFNHKGYSPREKYITFYKGDLHTFNLNRGKFGRYVNLPSIMGASDYSDLNFGKSKPGAIIEIVEKNSPNIITIPIWF